MSMNTTGTVGPVQNTAWTNKWLAIHDDNEVTGITSTYYDIPAGSTKILTLNKDNVYDGYIGELEEGITPAATPYGNTSITVTTTQYGAITIITDVMELTNDYKTAPRVMNRMQRWFDRTIEYLNLTELLTATNTYGVDDDATGDVVASYSGTSTDVDGFLTLEAQQTVTQVLINNKADTFRELVRPSGDYASSPVGATFIGYAPKAARTKLYNLIKTSGTLVEAYSRPEQSHKDEVGVLDNVRWILSDELNNFSTGDGANSGTVYPTFILGMDSWGKVRLSGGSFNMYNRDFGYGTDTLNQRKEIGLKFWHAAAITNDDWLIRLDIEV